MPTKNDWSDWEPLSSDISYNLPAVYEIRLKSLTQGIQRWL
ncbi:MAG: hypothetical protein HeimC3_22600 [Candidatus Heimdallarchaeota archaeon LC_3]|nr:MAG: hypothetical protein HeimC3_22600 [Candidatus Heimdallarchaeota archaeon LC_3]